MEKSLSVRRYSFVGYCGSSLRRWLIFCCLALKEAPVRFSMKWQYQFLLQPFSGWIGVILFSPWSLSSCIPNLLTCPYNHRPLLSWYSWRVWTFPNVFTWGIEVSEKMSHFQNKNKNKNTPENLYPSNCPFILYLNMAVLCHSVLLAAITKCSFEYLHAITEF